LAPYLRSRAMVPARSRSCHIGFTASLAEVDNPSSLSVTSRDESVIGTVVSPALEGTRPFGNPGG